MSISQETFDGVVKENMEDFGLDRKAALDEAIQQFKSQGQLCKRYHRKHLKLVSPSVLEIETVETSLPNGRYQARVLRFVCPYVYKSLKFQILNYIFGGLFSFNFLEGLGP